jgi:hypothetical protein
LVKVVTTGGLNNGQTQSICYDRADNRTNYVADTSAGATQCIEAPALTQLQAPNPSLTSTSSLTPTPTATPSPGNSPPMTGPDGLSAFDCTGTFFVNLTANNTDPEGNYPLVVTNISRNRGAAVATIVSSSAVQVDLGGIDLDVTGFVYTVRDSLGATSTGDLTVNAGKCGGGSPLP